MKRLSIVAPLILLGACSRLQSLVEPEQPTLADLAPVELPAVQGAVPAISRQDLINKYQQALLKEGDAETQLKVQHRLADLAMVTTQDDEQADSAPGLKLAIKQYQSILQSNPEYAQRDEIMYQLAKAYDLQGNSEQSQKLLQQLSSVDPSSPHLSEVLFRQAERHFARAEYAKAQSLYQAVTANGEHNPFYTRALYMQGWSLFKQRDYAAAVPVFDASLGKLLQGRDQLASLSRSDREIAEDTLRVLAITFDYLGGANALASLEPTTHTSKHLHLLYQSLSELYLVQERYRDSATVLQTYTQNNPLSEQTHRFQLLVINTFEQGGFDELVLQSKTQYVQSFALHSPYWDAVDSATRKEIESNLVGFLPELANHYHSLAQSTGVEDDRQQKALYRQASIFYRHFIDAFPAHEKSQQSAFLLGDCLYEINDYAGAVEAYEMAAYDFANRDPLPDAGYGAVSAYRAWAIAEVGMPRIHTQGLHAQVRFAEQFPQDSRANAALANAASEFLQLADYKMAYSAAQRLLEKQPVPDKALLIPSWLVLANSTYALDDFSAAETAYASSLHLMTSKDQRFAETKEQLAVAIYRQGEEAEQSGDLQTAAWHYERVLFEAPNTKARISAQYAAAQTYITLGEYSQANLLLESFRQHFPDHELSSDIGTLLVQNHEATQSWEAAADELARMSAINNNSEQAREAALVAANYYDKSGAVDKAVRAYKHYVEHWITPFDDSIEVSWRLSELYAEAGDSASQEIWLSRTADLHDRAGSVADDRSFFLAAQSTCTLGSALSLRFDKIQLVQPLKRSLSAKRSAMESALKTYKRCNSYAVESFATQATYAIARLYQKLSTALLESQRPDNLNALALEQYNLMLEELAYPFEELAITTHQVNAERTKAGGYDKWVRKSYADLAELLPARYGKRESIETEANQDKGFFAGIRQSKLRKLNALGIERREAGDFSGAEAAYKEAIALQEDYAPTHRNLGILYDIYMGEPDKAIYHYSRLTELDLANERTVIGWIAELQRRPAAATTEIL